jgi:PRC-barrel domain
MAHNLIASDRVEGTPVCRPTGEQIGVIQRLMIDKLSGQIAYAVLSFGGFLGFGQKTLSRSMAIAEIQSETRCL